MLFTVLIPVHNKLNLTSGCLYELTDHLSKLNTVESSVVVIDDGSEDGTSDWIQTKLPEVIVLKGDGNLWWSGAMNLGGRYAVETLKSEYLLLWNNDITFRNDYFTNLVKILETEEFKNTIIGSKIYVEEKPDLVWSMGGHFNPKNGDYYMHGYFKNDGAEYLKIWDVDWLTGMGTVIPAQVAVVNNFWNNKDFPQYHGDSDLTYRAKKKGTRVIVHPELVLYNKTKSSGIEHSGSWKKLIRLLVDIRSKSNFNRNLRFYKIHAKSFRAYIKLFSLYFKIFAGFYKWKLLNMLHIQKKNNA